jgi:hypothetical protein
MKGNCDICGQATDDLVDCCNPHCDNVVCSECRVESDNGYLCKQCEKKIRKVSTRWERKKKIRDSLLHP